MPFWVRYVASPRGNCEKCRGQSEKELNTWPEVENDQREVVGGQESANKLEGTSCARAKRCNYQRRADLPEQTVVDEFQRLQEPEREMPYSRVSHAGYGGSPKQEEVEPVEDGVISSGKLQAGNDMIVREYEQ